MIKSFSRYLIKILMKVRSNIKRGLILNLSLITNLSLNKSKLRREKWLSDLIFEIIKFIIDFENF